MPYSTLATLPDAVKGLPKHAQEIWQSAFNSAFKQYDGNEGKSAGTAWAAVKTKYRKDEKTGKWVAKEAIHAHGEHVCVCPKCDKETIVQENVKCNTQTCPDCGTRMRAKDIGERRESMDTLRTKYADIVQEVAIRDMSSDGKRATNVMTLCSEIFNGGKDDDSRLEEANVQADEVLTWLREQAVMKTDNGVKYPAAAYAYVPDKEKPSTWKLRLWEDPTKKITRVQLGRAAAALSPGGFRGQKVAIPSADLPAVKRKIRAEYRKLNVKDEDIPRWVREAMSRELILNYVPLTEAKFDKGRAAVIVIKPGFNVDKSRYYPAEVLKRDYAVFEGQKMYADHPTGSEEKELPERSIKNTGWVAVLKDVTCDDSGIVSGIAEIIEPWLMTKLATLRDKGLLSEMGISINAVGEGSEATIEGTETLVIEKLRAARSVDFVTEPGAGGIVTFYESNRFDIDLVGLPALRERRPDLIKALETDIRTQIHKEVKKVMENEERIAELEGQVTTLTTERDGLKEAAEKAEKDKAKAEAQATIKEAVDKAELPDAAKAKLLERFKDTESADGIDEAIKAEVDYIAALSEAGKVKGLGSTKVDSEESRKQLTESFKGLGLDDEEAKTAALGR